MRFWQKGRTHPDVWVGGLFICWAIAVYLAAGWPGRQQVDAMTRQVLFGTSALLVGVGYGVMKRNWIGLALGTMLGLAATAATIDRWIDGIAAPPILAFGAYCLLRILGLIPPRPWPSQSPSAMEPYVPPLDQYSASEIADQARAWRKANRWAEALAIVNRGTELHPESIELWKEKRMQHKLRRESDAMAVAQARLDQLQSPSAGTASD